MNKKMIKTAQNFYSVSVTNLTERFIMYFEGL